MEKIGLNPSLRRIVFALQPSDAEFHSMLADLAGKLGWRGVAAVLGISVRTLDSWREGRNGPSAGARKLVWLVHSILLKPGKLRSLFDVITYGRFVSD